MSSQELVTKDMCDLRHRETFVSTLLCDERYKKVLSIEEDIEKMKDRLDRIQLLIIGTLMSSLIDLFFLFLKK